MSTLRVCIFEAVGPITPGMKYEGFKKTVLRAGRFSVFEATANKQAADLYTQLCSDPEIEIENMGYPWTEVRKKSEGAG